MAGRGGEMGGDWGGFWGRLQGIWRADGRIWGEGQGHWEVVVRIRIHRIIGFSGLRSRSALAIGQLAGCMVRMGRELGQGRGVIGLTGVGGGRLAGRGGEMGAIGVVLEAIAGDLVGGWADLEGGSGALGSGRQNQDSPDYWIFRITVTLGTGNRAVGRLYGKDGWGVGAREGVSSD